MAANTLNAEAFLANLPLFKELSGAQRARIAERTRQLRVTRGETLFRRGDLPAGIYIVAYGQVKVSFVSSAGVEKVIEIFHQGQSFGEAVMFLGVPHVVTGQALSDSLLLLVPKETVFEGVDHDPAFARCMLAGLSGRLLQRMADVESYSTRSGTERLIGFLLRDCSISESAEAGSEGELVSAEIELPVAKGVIASRLNLTQEHLSRILHDLSALGLIEVRGRHIHVRDLERLRKHAR
jgi:CRP/FNR family transcriptional regulator, dissimilatory nitrate respiration regulator